VLARILRNHPWRHTSIMEKKDRESSSKLLKSVLARAANDPDTPIRADSPEFAEVPRLLTASGWEWMLDEEFEHYGLPGATLLYTPDSTEAGAAFARDCWEIYFSKNAFRVNHLMYLPELLLRRVGGVEVARKWLKTVHVTVSISEFKENQSGWVQRTLEGLLKCEGLEEVTILLTSSGKGDRDLVQRVLAEEVLPVASQIREAVRDECIMVAYAIDWWAGGKVLAWQEALRHRGESKRGDELHKVQYDRDVADELKRRKQFEMD
jgi:hypothetical protein